MLNPLLKALDRETLDRIDVVITIQVRKNDLQDD